MNKAQLIEALSPQFNGSKAEAGRALNAVVETIIYQTAQGEKVSVTGFGVFERIHRPTRMVRNPRTGERKRAKATYVPKFRAGSELKAYVSGEKKVPRAARNTAAGTAGAAKKTAATKTTATPAPAKKTAAKKTTAKAAPAKKTAAKKTTAKAAPAKKTAAKKTTARATPARTAAAKKTTARATARKATAAKTTAAKKTTAKKAPARKSTAKRTAKR